MEVDIWTLKLQQNGNCAKSSGGVPFLLGILRVQVVVSMWKDGRIGGKKALLLKCERAFCPLS